MDTIIYKGVRCRPGTYRVMGEDRPALYLVSAPDDQTVYDAGFTEVHMAGPWVKILTDEEYGELAAGQIPACRDAGKSGFDGG